MKRFAAVLAACCLGAPWLNPGTTMAAPAPDSTSPLSGVPEETVVKGRCRGGGRITFAATRGSDGRYTVVAAASHLPPGSRWDGGLSWEPADGSSMGDGEAFRERAAGGSWTRTMVFETTKYPYFSLVASGPHDRVCSVLSQPARPLAAVTDCRGDRSLSLTAVRKPTGRTVVRAAGVSDRARPGKEWQMAVSWETPRSATGVATMATMKRNIIRIKNAFRSVPNKRIHFSVTGPGGHTCGMRVVSNSNP